MALPTQLRMKTTSERLRTNHIDLLEYTEKLSQENETLKRNMAKILRSSSLTNQKFTVEEDEDAEPEEDYEKMQLLSNIEEFRKEIDRLNKQVLAAETEKKTLKAKAQMKSKPENDERVNNLRARLDEEIETKKICLNELQISKEKVNTLLDENKYLQVEIESLRQVVYHCSCRILPSFLITGSHTL